LPDLDWAAFGFAVACTALRCRALFELRVRTPDHHETDRATAAAPRPEARASQADTPRALLVAPAGRAHHFAGVPETLHAMGWGSTCEVLQPHAPVRVTSAMAQAARVIVHADGVNANAIGIWNAAERAGRPVALVMDGVVEFANTFLNTAAGREFLRPAPADVVLAAGLHDASILQALGNHTIATGLPRLSAFEKRVAGMSRRDGMRGECTPHDESNERSDILIATANQVAFTEGGRRRIAASLLALRDALQRRGVRARWRVRGDLAELLGVTIDRDTLEVSLARSRAAISTASTLVLEAMIAGVPVVVMHPHPWPLWIPAAWRWHGASREQWDDDAERTDAALQDPAARRACDAARESLDSVMLARDGVAARTVDELLDALLDPQPAAMQTQARALAHCHAGPAAGRAARAIIDAQRERAERPISIVTEPRPQRAVRVVSLLEAHASSVGGVSVWNERMREHFAGAADLDVEWHVLTISGDTGPLRAPAGGASAAWRGVDPTSPLTDQVVAIVRHIAPDERTVVLPNYGDLAHAAAMHARALGARVIAAAHTNDEVFRGFLSRYDVWDAAVAVSGACEPWVRELARDRAVARIVYGVPMHPPRARDVQSIGAPLRLAYVGRMVEAQKRVSDLLRLVEALRRAETPHELHIVGDGDALPAWRRDAERRGLLSTIVLHGAQSEAWVQRFWSSVDVCVITSEAEGTSIAMLEAMAAGVLPCVTRVDAGVDAFVRDGENGVAVPVGEMEQMAARLAALALDRGALAAMATAAQRTIVDHGLTVDACARAWAAIANEVVRRGHARSVVTDLALRAPGARAGARGGASATLITRHLRDAGFTRVVHGEPPSDAARTAVLVRATDQRPSRATIDAWRARGVGVAVEPTLMDDAGAPLGRWFAELCESGAERVAVYSDASVPTAWLDWFAEHAGPRFVGFVVACAPEFGCSGARASLLGARVASASHVGEVLRPDAIVLPCIDDDLGPFAATWTMRRAGVRVHPTPSDAAVRARVDDAMAAARGCIARGERVLTTLPTGVLAGAADLERATKETIDSCGVAVLRGDETDFAWAARLAGAIERGARVHSLRWTTAEITSPARLARMVADMRGKAYAIFGGGLHTKRLLKYATLAAPPAAVLDDHAPLGAMVDGVPVVKPERALELGVRAVVLSSPRHEAAMWARSAFLREAGVRVLPMYADVATLESGR
jgi:glycosyltransferase involved in cell wall biosynthesis